MTVFSLESRITEYEKLMKEDPLFFSIERTIERVEQSVSRNGDWEKATNSVEEWIEARKFVANLFESDFPDRIIKMSFEKLDLEVRKKISEIERCCGNTFDREFTVLFIMMYAKLITYYLYKTRHEEIFINVSNGIRTTLDNCWGFRYFINCLYDLEHTIDIELENGHIPDTYDYMQLKGGKTLNVPHENIHDEAKESLSPTLPQTDQQTASLTSSDLSARDIVAIFLAYDLPGRFGIKQKELNAMAAQLADKSPSTFHNHWSGFANGDTGYDKALRNAKMRREELLGQ